MLHADALVQHLHDRQAHVEPDEVRELERAHRMVQADPRARVDVLGGADALLEARIASARNGIRIRLTMKPGPVGGDDDLLAELRRRARGSRASVASVVAAPRISSTSGMTGTGLKKCIPTNRARRAGATASASASIEIELVFEAKIALRRRDPVERAPQAALDVEILEYRLDRRGPRRRPARGRPSPSIRPSVASRSSASSRPLATARSRLPAIRSRPASARASSGS